MKVDYRGFEIDVCREQSLAGYSMLYFTVMRESDGWFLIDSFSESDDTPEDMVEGFKKSVDDYLENPEDWDELDDEEIVCVITDALEPRREPPMIDKTLIFDFDGVIHSYASGWQGAEVANDPPVPGIRQAIKEIREAGYRVVVVSSRCHQEGGMECIRKYLKVYAIEVDDVCRDKVPALLTIDDRAIYFDGDTKGLLEKVQGFRTWYGKE